MRLLSRNETKVNMQKKLFGVTGGAGLVGAQLILNLVRKGHRVVTIIRRTANQTPSERFLDAIEMLNISSDEKQNVLDSVITLDADIEKEKLGLQPASYQACKNKLSGIFHSAGYVDFQQKHDASIFWRQNVKGSENALKWAHDSQCPFFYISTAYAGHGSGSVAYENLNGIGSGRNHYENSKIEAEWLISKKAEILGIPYAILRPTILMGSKADGASLNFRNMYQFMKALKLIGARHKRINSRTNSPQLRIPLNPEDTLNITPVDISTESMTRICVDTNNWNGKIFNLSHPKPINFQKLATIFEQLFDVKIQLDQSIKNTSDDESLSKEEASLKQILKPFEEYLGGEPHFDTTNSQESIPEYSEVYPELDLEYFSSLMNFAEACAWGRKSKIKSRNFDPSPEYKKNKSLSDQSASSNAATCYSESYFIDYLREKTGKRLIENLYSLTCNFIISINEEPDFYWNLEIDSGVLKSVKMISSSEPAKNRSVDCHYKTDLQTFKLITQGKLSASHAFFTRRVDIQGNFEEGLRTATALQEFFQIYPYSSAVELHTSKDFEPVSAN